MKTSLWRKFPKWAIAATIVVVSTGLFAFWWFFLKPRWNLGSGSTPTASRSEPSTPEPDEWERRRVLAETLSERVDTLVVAGNDLYDVETAELIFQNWLQGGCPPVLYYDAGTRKFIGIARGGLVRYDFTGKKNAVIGEPYGAAFTHGFKLALYAKGGDIWKAIPDWSNFTLTKDLQVTKGGQFTDAFMTQNIQMATDNMLVVRQLPNLLEVNLNTGDMRPTRLPPGNSFQNQSPDGRMLAGMIREGRITKFYAYDVEKDNAETFELPARKALNEIMWLGDDRCVVLAGGDILLLYDRKRNAFNPLVSLPMPCNKILGPSQGGKRFFCGSRRGALLIDVEAKTSEPFLHPAENMDWLSDDALIYSATLPDSARRGTWFMRVGAEPVRLTEEPYVFTRGGKSCEVVLKKRGLVAFGTASGLFRAETGGIGFTQVKSWRSPAGALIAIENWAPAK